MPSADTPKPSDQRQTRCMTVQRRTNTKRLSSLATNPRQPARPCQSAWRDLARVSL